MKSLNEFSESEKTNLIKQIFSKYVPEEKIDEILNSTPTDHYVLSKRDIGYVLLELKQDGPFLENYLKATDFAIKNRFIIDTSLGTIIFLTSGAIGQIETDLHEKVQHFIDKFPNALLKSVRGVYGVENCLTGNIGNEGHMQYTSLLNSFFRKINELSKLEYGNFKSLCVLGLT